MREIWKKITDLDAPDYYEVSNLGRVRSLPYVDKRGWRRKLYNFRFKNAEIGLTLENGTKRRFPVAQLVLRAFIGPPNEGQYLARHLDDNRQNNHVDNLAWGNDADNRADAIRNGRSFISLGHLGKRHSEETKRVLREQRLGKPTGHKMTPEHRAAIWNGYRKKFPEKTLMAQNCACGCGQSTKPGRSFIHGHAGGARFAALNKSRIGKPRAW